MYTIVRDDVPFMAPIKLTRFADLLTASVVYYVFLRFLENPEEIKIFHEGERIQPLVTTKLVT